MNLCRNSDPSIPSNLHTTDTTKPTNPHSIRRHEGFWKVFKSIQCRPLAGGWCKGQRIRSYVGKPGRRFQALATSRHRPPSARNIRSYNRDPSVERIHQRHVRSEGTDVIYIQPTDRPRPVLQVDAAASQDLDDPLKLL